MLGGYGRILARPASPRSAPVARSTAGLEPFPPRSASKASPPSSTAGATSSGSARSG